MKNTRNTPITIAAALVVSAVLLAAPAHAVLLMYEPFDYSGSSLEGQKGSSESGLETTNGWDDDATLPADAWGMKGPVTLSNDDTSLGHFHLLAPVGDRINDTGNGTADRGLSGFSVDMGSNETYYMSALIKGEAVVQFHSNVNARAGFGINGDGEFTIGFQELHTANARANTYSGGTYSSTETYFLPGGEGRCRCVH